MRTPEHSNITSYHILDLARIFVIDWEQQRKTMNEKIYFALSIDERNITPGQIHVHIHAFIHSIQWRKCRMEQKIDWKKKNNFIFETQSFVSILLSKSRMIDYQMIYYVYTPHFPMVHWILSASVPDKFFIRHFQ